MLVMGGAVLFGIAAVVVSALGHAASETADGWRLDEARIAVHR